MNTIIVAFLLPALILVIFSDSKILVSSLGSMSSIAVSYGENGPVFCGLSSDGSHLVSCYGADSSVVYGSPSRFPFSGLTAGDGFVCGLLMDSNQPYCWGNNIYIQMGVPQPMVEGATYKEISAGDHHLCGLRTPNSEIRKNTSVIDCWGYNMTASHVFGGEFASITAGSVFNCGLFAENRTAFCWGDETGSGVIGLTPRNSKFQLIAAGGFHVCGVLQGGSSRVLCWGRSLSLEEPYDDPNKGNVLDLVPEKPIISVVGGRFHACGIKTIDHGVICWGFRLENSTPAPNGVKLYAIVAGDYFTCGVLAENSLKAICWGSGFPTAIPMAVSPGLCISGPCGSGFYEFTKVNSQVSLCKSLNSRVCMACSSACPAGMIQSAPCTPKSDRLCEIDCSDCVSSECLYYSYCSSLMRKKNGRSSSFQTPVFVAELAFAVVLVSFVSLATCFYVRYKLRKCDCSRAIDTKTAKNRTCSFRKESVKIRPDLEELKIRRAQTFTYEELEKATGGFSEESQVGKGSFSCVFKGVLRDGTVVAVKRAILAPDLKKNSSDFHTELDLLSRLNHAHLLNLLGYCEEGGERLLVYEFMANGSLHQHLHGKDSSQKDQLDWIRRVTIAVQAARGIEYLHGYACPPVIHRDIKSSNILIDEEHNARVSDFGLSLLGPTDSSSPLSELPAGTLGYLDPEYYRLHYLTTKSDVYSFGVLLLEILSGRKAIDMQFEEGNIVEWAVPLIKAGDVSMILDPALKPPSDLEALRRIANVASKCVRMRGKERPSMDRVTTALERALALLMGGPCNEQPILPTEVVLGSSRLHKKASQRSSNRSASDVDIIEAEDQRFEFRAPSWITFPSVTSSQRRKSSVSDGDVDTKNSEGRNPGHGSIGGGGDGLRSLEEEIGPVSPQEDLFLKHNF